MRWRVSCRSRPSPLEPTLFGALWIGAVGGVIVVFAVPMLDKFKIDDVVGAIPVHLVAGFWGTMAVPFYAPDTSFVTQFIGFAAIGIFVFVTSLIVWIILKGVMGIRVERRGRDQRARHGRNGHGGLPRLHQGLISLPVSS